MVSIRRLILATKRASDKDAFQYREDIFRYIYARINQAEEAEDMTMEVVHAASQAGTNNLRTYMIGIARHKVTDHYRRKALREPLEIDEVGGNLEGADQFLFIQSVLQSLPENYQESLVLKYVCGFSIEEMAQMVSQSKSAVDSTLQRARKAFASEWNPWATQKGRKRSGIEQVCSKNRISVNGSLARILATALRKDFQRAKRPSPPGEGLF